ncbi:MAG: hypothetical protein QM639_10710 [Rhodocyclaceae bacterium]
MRPRLKAVIVLAPTDGASIGLLFGGTRTDITLEHGELSSLGGLLANLSGLWTLPEVARLSNVALADAEAVVARLHEAGLVYEHTDADDDGLLDADDIHRSSAAFIRAIRFDFGRHPLFAALATSERLFVACACEYWFLIRDAGTHIALALHHAPAPLKPMLAAHLAEERDHAEHIAPALAAALDLPVAALAQACPCAAADAALIKTRVLAQHNVLGYLAATSFCEAPLGHSASPTPAPSWSAPTHRLFAALAGHFEEDRAAGHASLFANAIDALNTPIPRRDLARALEAAHQYKHYLDNLNHEILRTYAMPGSMLPHVSARYDDFAVGPEPT